MNFTLRQLEYAVAIAKCLNFSRAAEQCFVSQPSLSAQVAQLETALGQRLFERSSKGVALTRFGTEFVERARRTLEGLEELEQLARSYRQPLAGDLRVGAIPTLAPYVVPALVPAIRAKHPACRLLLTEDTTQRLVQRAESGNLDVLLLALETELGACETVELARDAFVVALPPEHALGERGAVTLADLASEELLLLEDGHCLSDQIRAVCSAARNTALDFRAGSLATLVQMVALGHGVTLLPQIACEALLAAAPSVVTRPLGERAFRTLGLAWRRAHPRRAEFALLAKTLAPLVARGQ